MFNHVLRSLFSVMALTLLVFTFVQAESNSEESWPTLKKIYFKNHELNEADWLVLEAPSRAEDAAIVPITVKSLKPQTASRYIKNITIIIDENPDPYSANFHLNPAMEQVDLTFRMRVQQYSYVRAIAEMNDGSMYMTSRFVKASGGCSAPVQKDPAAVKTRLGKMQIRIRNAELAQKVPAQVIISHPNYNGLQFDQKTRGYFPAHYVKSMTVTYADKTLFNVDMGISFSEDPSIHFTFQPTQHAELKAVVVDSKEVTYTAHKML